ncbi:MAG: hypothetical protein Q8L10_04500 [Candidatus Moranbacteria bacterium]|nr:hypothetical protein [Candidatus Moranbacteria bacterium]
MFTMDENKKMYLNKYGESLKFIFIIFSVIAIATFTFLFFAPVINAF